MPSHDPPVSYRSVAAMMRAQPSEMEACLIEPYAGQRRIGGAAGGRTSSDK
jgi:hypothetical protein